MLEIILCKGLPASGKSTWAKTFVHQNKGWKRTNKDELRSMLDSSLWSKDNEKFVLSMRDYIVEEALKNDLNVIIDDTNFEKRHFDQMCLIAQQFNKDITVREIYFPIELEEAIKRNNERIKAGTTLVTTKIIEDFYNRYIKGRKIVEHTATFSSNKTERIVNKDLPKAVIVDVDGTIAIIGDRSPFDASKAHEVDSPNGPIIEIVKSLYSSGYEIIFCSGREDKFREQTERFIKTHLAIDPEVMEFELFMRKTGDMRKDSIIKAEIYKEHIEPKYNVLLCLDDRVQVVKSWRNLGLTCLQVAEGMF